MLNKLYRSTRRVLTKNLLCCIFLHVASILQKTCHMLLSNFFLTPPSVDILIFFMIGFFCNKIYLDIVVFSFVVSTAHAFCYYVALRILF